MRLADSPADAPCRFLKGRRHGQSKARRRDVQVFLRHFASPICSRVRQPPLGYDNARHRALISLKTLIFIRRYRGQHTRTHNTQIEDSVSALKTKMMFDHAVPRVESWRRLTEATVQRAGVSGGIRKPFVRRRRRYRLSMQRMQHGIDVQSLEQGIHRSGKVRI